MNHSFGDPNEIFSTLKNFKKKSRKASKGEQEEKNSESGKILEISGVISLNTETSEQCDKEAGDKLSKSQDKKWQIGPERKSFPSLKFKIGGRKKSKQDEESKDSRRTSKDLDGVFETDSKENLSSFDPEKMSTAGSTSSASDERNELNQRESMKSANDLALEILREINTNNLEILGSTTFDTPISNSQNVDSDEIKETVELRNEPTAGENESDRNGQKTRSGNYYLNINLSDEGVEKYVTPSPEGTSSITWPTLNQEPLYQLYSLNSESENKNNIGSENSKRPRIVDLVSTERRIYWRDIPEVTEFGYSEKLSQDERNLQEAKFEILTSESSYLKSLKTLEIHYIKNILLLGLRSKHLLSEGDLKILFGNVVEVRKVSESFLKDLEELWQNDILLRETTRVIWDHSRENFQIYKIFSKKYLDMTQKCNDLIAQKEEFKDLLEKLRQSPPAKNLPMTSFFALPIQRIARYHMLVENVLKFMKKGSDEYEDTLTLWEYLKELARQCDEEIEKRKRTEEMVRLIRQLEFPPEVETICILKSTRYLVLQNQIQRIAFKERFDRQHISIKKISLQLFLFNDLLVIAKKSLDKLTPEHLVVVDYCLRKLAKIKPMKKLELLGIRELIEIKPLILSLQSNHKSESIEMMITFEKSSDREQWLAALESAPSIPSNPSASRTVSYAQTELSHVLITHDYEASNWGELTLHKGDVISIKEKKTEVWYLGENPATGAMGWFPEECTGKLSLANLKQMKKETHKSGEKIVFTLEGFSTPCESSA